MKQIGYSGVIAVLLAVFIASGCLKLQPAPKTKTTSGQTVILKYQFPKGRALKYHTKSDSRMRFTMPFIPNPQQVKSESDMNTIEEVLQEPIRGFALIEQRIEAFRFILYQGNKVVFDSARANEFQNQPQFDPLLKLKGMKIRYQMSQTGEIRAVEGMENFAETMGPANISQIFQSAQPTLPDRPLATGESWKSRYEIPVIPGKGFSGAISITDETRLIEVRKEGNSQRAVIELARNVSIDLKSVTGAKKRKSKSLVQGKGESVFTIIFDIDRGIIIQSDGRIKVSTSTAASDQPNLNQITMDVEGIMSTVLVE